MKARVLTAAVLIPVVLAAVFFRSPWPLIVLASVAAVLGSFELATIQKFSPWWTVPCLVATVAVAYFGRHDLPLLFLVGVVGCGLSPLAGLYVAAPLASLATFPTHPVEGMWDFRPLILIALVPLWIGDTAAILVGKWLGKHPMAPSISPKKTWEGGIANLIGCILGAIAVGQWVGVRPEIAALIGSVQGVLGQVGDLFESQLKRTAGVKDSGTILPGHGGVLDRIDSILFTAPWVALLVQLG